MAKLRPLESRYVEAMESHSYVRDAAQQRAVAHLEDLCQRLIDKPRDFGFFKRRMLQLLPGRTSIEPVRGHYLWGGVGRGKTMLMDLFYDSLPFADRARRHFHRFIHDVHDELGKLKSHAHPLELVAHRIATRTRVICLDEFFVADIADAMILDTLFRGLFRRGVTLVATSNVAPRDLYRDGMQRQRFLPAIRQIKRHTEVMHVDGAGDYRLRELRKASIYVDSKASNAVAQLKATFAAIAGEPGVPDGTSPSSTGAFAPYARRRKSSGSNSTTCARAHAAKSTTSSWHVAITPSWCRTYRPSTNRPKMRRGA